MGRKPKQKRPDIAEKVGLQGDFARALLEFKSREPAAQREANRRGATLVVISEHKWIGVNGVLLTTDQSLSYRFERRSTVPKSKRAKCGAKTRAGGACRATVCLKANGRPAKRCRMHGGKSTGARTQAGRDAIAESNRRRARQMLTKANVLPARMLKIVEIGDG